jgi:hypothetical protein
MQSVEWWRTDVAKIVNLPPLPGIAYDEYDTVCESDDYSVLGVAEGKAPISLKQMEFSSKQLAKRMGQPNWSAFNKLKKVSVVGFLERSISPLSKNRTL